jgi:hypothetical protein
MGKFKKGDPVMRIEISGPYGLRVGATHEVEEVDDNSGWLALEGFDRPAHNRFPFDPTFFVPAGSKAPQWAGVAEGDTIAVRYKKTGQEFTTEAHETFDRFNGPEFLGHDINSKHVREAWELLSIEKPKPQPPTAPGSHVTVPFPGWESGINHLFLLDSGKWLSQTGAGYWPPEDVASKNFTVIHDAGKGASAVYEDQPL